MNKHLLYEVLAAHNIPYPPKGLRDTGFTRWGDHRGGSKYWVVPIGEGFAFGDWSTDLKACVFPKTEKFLTAKQLAKRRKDIAKAREEIEHIQFQEQAKATQVAWNIYQESEPASDDHPYLKRKQVKTYGTLKITTKRYLINPATGYAIPAGTLMIPLVDVDGNISSLQFITYSGAKINLLGGRKQGCFCPIGKLSESTRRMYLAEGIATGLSIHEAMRNSAYEGCVVICFDAGNLQYVAIEVRCKYPNVEIVIAADNDCYKNINTGLIKAKEAEAAIGGATIIWPEFRLDIKMPDGKQPTDWNDLYILDGIYEVRRQIEQEPSRIAKEKAAKNVKDPNRLFTSINNPMIRRIANNV